MSLIQKMNANEKINPGSNHKEFLHEVIKREMELQLRREITSEEDFRHACLDYLKIDPGFRPLPEKLRDHKVACYSCLQTANEPQAVIVDNTIVSLHMECITNYVIDYLTKQPFSNFIAPKKDS